jgi:hypothetical protein
MALLRRMGRVEEWSTPVAGATGRREHGVM